MPASAQTAAALKRLTRWIRGLVALTCVIVLACVILFVRDSARARESQRLAITIQEQRAEGYRVSCLEQNERHDKTVAELKVLVKKAGRPESAANPTIALIDALVPVRDCAKLVQERVG